MLPTPIELANLIKSMLTSWMNTAERRKFGFIVLMGPFIASMMIGLTAFLQATSQWWKGPTAAVLIFLFGFLFIVVGTGESDLSPDGPVLTLAASTWICAASILLGSVLAIILRSYISPGKLAIWVFVGGYVLLSIVGLTIAFT